MTVSRKLEILQRLGKNKEAREFLKESAWYRCGSLYYKPSAKIILEGGKTIQGELDIKNCYKVPFDQVDALNAKIGITTMPSKSNPQPKGRCCR